MNFDLGVLALALLCAATGYRSGAVRQVSSWLGLAAAYFCARPLTAAWAGPAASSLGWSPGVTMAGLTVTLWVILYMGASQIARVVLNVLEPGEERGPLDKMLGAVAGAGKGGAIALAVVSVLLALEKPLQGLGVDMTKRTEGSHVMAFARQHRLVGSPREQASAAASKAVEKGVEAGERARGAAAALKVPAQR